MTEAEAYQHLCDTFDLNCRNFPEIMEPYMVMIADTVAPGERTEIMREGLRSTFNARFPRRVQVRTQEAAE